MISIGTALDVNFFYLINKGCANPFFDVVMPYITKLADGRFIAITALLLFLLVKKSKKISGIFLLAGLTAAYFTIDILKGWIARPRPFVVLSDVHSVIPLAFHAKNDFSFPSGHATIAFMAAVILSKFFKRPAIWFTLAVLVCFSRVYLGVHYVSDVCAGAILGIMIGYVLIKIVDNMRVF